MGMRIRGPLACALALSALAGAVPPARAQETPDVRVLAAASLTEVVAALAKRFQGARVVTSFGA